MVRELIDRLESERPLIHCITNPISINQCANALLAVGARPMMAEHPEEAAEITATAGGLLINLGNVTDSRMRAMEVSVDKAREMGIPWVLDAVGAACSSLRRPFGLKLIENCRPTIIQGKYSEIMALADAGYSSAGVDAAQGLEIEDVLSAAGTLARDTTAVLLASGETDIVTDGEKALLIKNGTPQLGSVTGTGCMLGALCAAFASVAGALEAAADGCLIMGISGELAETDRGSGTFMSGLMDALSRFRQMDGDKYARVEEIGLERL